MLNKKIETALNEQINEEMFSSYLYLSMSAYFADINLNGFANWMRVQSQEEMAHAMKIFDYVCERGGKVILKAIAQPESKWKNTLEVVDETMKHEMKVTALINKLADLAVTEKDHATGNFLQWFVTEQVEEEANVTDLLNQLKMIKGEGPGLFMLDRELKTRVFVPIAQ